GTAVRERPTARALAAPGRVHATTVDVTNASDIDRATAEATSELGGIDILVGNAGISGPNHPLWEYPLDEWRRVIDVDLVGIFYCCRAIVPKMRAQNY